jgi:DNA-binding NtrC family response regulator
MAHLLVVDDAYHEVRAGLDAVLVEHRVSGATDGAAALRLIESEPTIDVVLLDVRMPPLVGDIEEEEGLAVFEKIKEIRPDLPVIFLSAYDDLRLINRALTAGGFWYLKKPPDLEETRSLVRRAVELSLARRDSSERRTAAEARLQAASRAGVRRRNSRLIGDSALLGQLSLELAMFAATDVPVLLLGETGCGKELCAHELHDLSARRGGPFIAVNCHELNQRETAQSRLFGHSKGAFTGAVEETPGAFESAHGGTLFLDEIGDLDLDMQGRLLRVLQEREVVRIGAGERPRAVDVRMIFATNRNPEVLVQEGIIREDFYYRIAVGVVRAPGLREHLEDLELLVPALLKAAAARDRIPECTVDPAVYPTLRKHSWPGNVRELENVLKRGAVKASAQGVILPDHINLPEEENLATEPTSNCSDLFTELLENGGYANGLKRFRDEYGEIAMREVLSRAVRLAGSVVRAGELLGFVRPESRAKDYENLRAWMKTLGLRKSEITQGGLL